MKTHELLDKYTKLINALLGSKEVKFFHRPGSYNFTNGKVISWKEIGHEVEAADEKNDKPAIHYDWSIGHYRLDIDGYQYAAEWKLYQMPHCCAICVSCNAEVAKPFRGKRLGTLLNNLRKELSTHLGYSLLLCTDIAQNEHQRKLLATNGWRDIYSVVNRRTGNHVYISVVNT